jgi:caffeoyl-CoA O-methyltransferase
MQFINELAEQYAYTFTTKNDAYLQKVYDETIANHPKNHMQSNWVQGMFLKLICKIKQANHVLEIGTFTGFSALCLASGIAEKGQVHTIECREEDAAKALENFQNASQKNKIHLHVGNALDIIPTLNYTWDIVYLDADKTNYIKYLELVLAKLNKNGLIIADNVLFHGEVLEENIKGKNAKAIHAFNQYIINNPILEATTLTVRDGLMLIQKKDL